MHGLRLESTRDLRVIRASDADRDEVVERLRDDCAAGRLTHDELAERVAAAHAARTLGELEALTRDLPREPGRDAELERALALDLAWGWSVEWRGDAEAILARPKRVRHGLHAVATVFTGGLWAIVWIVAAADRQDERRHVRVDERGSVRRRRLR